MSGKTRSWGVAVAVLFALVVGCVGNASADVAAPNGETTLRPATARMLVGKEFVTDEVRRPWLGPGVRVRIGFGKGFMTMRFGKRKIRARPFGLSAGCNGMGGAYRLKNGRMYTPLFYTTLVLCKPLDRLENALMAMITRVPKVRYGGGVLEFEWKGHLLRFQEMIQPEGEPRLPGTAWKLKSTTGPSGTVPGRFGTDPAPALRFTKEGFQIKTACTSVSGGVAIGAGVVDFMANRGSYGRCRRPVERQERRQRIGYLMGLVPYAFDEAENLVFTIGDDELTFVRK
ncbi:MAG: META domain-containing protein [Solirubrobacterales bacterium]|nr:META domain-containing protein [Solirubrobacterales bacterium]